MQALAVIRAQFAAAPEFEAIYSEVQRRLQGLSVQDRVRWYDLQRILITWGQHRRPKAERQTLLAATLNAQAHPGRRAEVEQMEKTIAEALIEEGEERGRLLQSRQYLRRLLTKKFKRLPEEIIHRIETTTDLDRLDACVDQIMDIQSLEELRL